MSPGVKKHVRKVLNDKALRYRVEKWFWVVNLPAVLYLFFFHREFWDEVSVLYLTLVSIYALVLTAGGAEQAAEAAIEASKD
jgi:hypothetical protein